MSANDPCIFCHPDRPILAENALAMAFYDAYPVSPGHALVVPRRHVKTIFDTTDAEYTACFALARTLSLRLIEAHDAAGFNLGVNCEEAGGQSVWHAHIHLIPRYTGDARQPLGGVRKVIPLAEEPAGRVK